MNTDTIKKRYWLLTAWLAFMMFSNTLAACSYLFAGEFIQTTVPTLTPMMVVILGVCSVLNVVFSAALFKWFKWGFWGFCVNTVIAAIINFMAHLGTLSILSGLFGPFILYGILHIGKEKQAWPQLK